MPRASARARTTMKAWTHKRSVNARAGELKRILTGSATKLESQFRLTYSMLLNLLRAEDVKVCAMALPLGLCAYAWCVCVCERTCTCACIRA